MSRNPLYSIWSGMHARCNDPANPAYKNYGGRGIAVCQRWDDYAKFCTDMGERPPGYCLERKNNDAGYSPDNCVWATRTEQSRNRRGLVQVTIDGETHPLSVWVERFGIVSYGTAHRRIVMGWGTEAAIKTAKVTRRKGIPRGVRIAGFDSDQMVKTPSGVMPLWQAIEASGLGHELVMQRLKRGWPIAKAIALSPRKGPRNEAFGANHGVTFIDQRGEAA